MSRYIDADAAYEAACEGADNWDGGCSPYRDDCIREELDKVPTVDAVPVVRCKDCKHYDGKWCLLLDMANSDMGDWYCAYGERKETDLKGKNHG